MRMPLTRRSFVRTTSTALAGAAFLGSAAKAVWAGAGGQAKRLALHGGTPVRSHPFSKIWPIFDENEEKALLKALRSRNWCCLRGNTVYDFEKTFAEAMSVRHCVLTNGGTTALRSSLAVLDVGPGDEVITSPHTFIATINVITNLHALPVFVDIDPDTGSIDADLIEKAITKHTRAILPIHLGGFPVDIQKVMAISKKYDIPVIEDACQSVFAEVNDKKVGTFGTTGCISFQEWKTLVCGEGGAILGDDEEVMRRCAAFINNGRDPKRIERGYPFPGSNHRMTDFQGAILTAQFERFKDQDARRQKNGQYVEKQLAKVPGLTPRKRYSKNTRITYFYFEMDYDRDHFKGVSAARFAEALRAEGIPMNGGERRYGEACHREKMLQEHLNSRAFKASFSEARLQKYCESIDLPMMDRGPSIRKERLAMETKIPFLGTKKEMDQIVEAVHKVAANVGALA